MTTASPMPASDVADNRLYAAGDVERLLAKYEPVIRARCIVRTRSVYDGQDVAQDVMLRLLEEARRGRTYTVPYRVAVHQVIQWTLAEFFTGKPTAVPLPDDWEPVSADD